MAGIVQPTGNAGELFVPALGQKIRLVEWREDSYYDHVSQTNGAVTAGTSLELFRDLTNKNIQWSNLRTARRIPAGSEFVMQRIGVLLSQAFSNTVVAVADILKVAYNGSLTMKINDRLIAEGPIVGFSTGLGMSGSTTATDTSLVTTGVPSLAAAPKLLVEQKVQDDDDLAGSIDFKANTWITGTDVMPTLAGRVVAGIFLRGLIKKPQGK